MLSVIEVHSGSPQETVNLGRAIGETLRGGELVELCGPLGAGKTQLAKGLALGLGVPDDEPVVSPTFVLVREYQGRLVFCHCDAYRLTSTEELLALGIEEMLDGPDTVIAIEWADRFPDALAAETLHVDLDYAQETARRIRISTANADRATELTRLLRAQGIEIAGPTRRR